MIVEENWDKNIQKIVHLFTPNPSHQKTQNKPIVLLMWYIMKNWIQIINEHATTDLSKPISPLLEFFLSFS